MDNNNPILVAPLFSEDRSVPSPTQKTDKTQAPKTSGHGTTLANLLSLWETQKELTGGGKEHLNHYLLEVLAEATPPGQWQDALEKAQRRLRNFIPL